MDIEDDIVNIFVLYLVLKKNYINIIIKFKKELKLSSDETKRYLIEE